MIRESCAGAARSGRTRGWAVAAQVLLLLAGAAPLHGEATEVTATAATGSSSGAPGAPETSGGAELETVIVTATRRTEDIKDIPTSVSAIDADTLSEHHVVNYDDLTRTVPGLSFQAGAGPGLDNIAIRGVS